MSAEASKDFVSYVRGQVETFGDTRAFTYLRDVDRELVEDRVDYAQLDADARAIAAWLAQRPEADRPVLLLYIDGIDFLRAFLGCLYAGVIAVPAPIPTDARSIARSAAMFDDAGIGLVLTTSAVLEPLTAWLREMGLGDRMAVRGDRRRAARGPGRLADARPSTATRWRSCSTRRAPPASPRASS